MIRLNLAQGPAWLDLAHGVRVEVLPMTTETRIRASYAIYGEDGTFQGDGPTRDILYAKSIAQNAIVGWEGVGDADGNPVAVTPEGAAALMDIYDLYHSFRSLYIVPGIAAVMEGNGSTPSPNGTSATATTTAVPAPPPAKRVRARSTRPKP